MRKNPEFGQWCPKTIYRVKDKKIRKTRTNDPNSS